MDDEVTRAIAAINKDLLEALKTARWHLKAAGHHEGLSAPLMAVDAAIAKAEGHKS